MIISSSSYVIIVVHCWCRFIFFFNDTATTEIYTLSLHDALPICPDGLRLATLLANPHGMDLGALRPRLSEVVSTQDGKVDRSEEHTSELQSRQYLVCRLLLEKKKKRDHHMYIAETHSLHARIK